MKRVAAACAAALSLSACASLHFIHDPQTGWINRADVPPLLQSVRCELVTFYDATRERHAQFNKLAEKNFDLATSRYAYFPLEDAQLGAIFLDLKVTDTIGIPNGSSGTNIDYKRTIDANHSKTWHFGPTAADTNTYEMNWGFVIPQKASLDISEARNAKYEVAPPEKDYFPCYQHTQLALSQEGYEGLARDHFPDTKRFRRIWVNGKTPLAAWLLDVGSEMGTTLFGRNLSSSTEQVTPAQMIYTFSVQVMVGADVKFSLVSTRWNPLAPDISGSTQQLSTLTLYVNGTEAPTVNAAKTGTVADLQAVGDKAVQLFRFPGTPPSQFECGKLPPNLCPRQRGHLLWPLPINPAPPGTP